MRLFGDWQRQQYHQSKVFKRSLIHALNCLSILRRVQSAPSGAEGDGHALGVLR
jgi:hypothetical protein